jgi:hypothetical protein
MKRVFLFLGAIMLTSVFLFTSCTEESDPVDLPPTINFVVEAGFISGNTTLTINTPFSVKVLATANATSAAKIQSIDITRIYNNQTIWDTTLTFNDASLPPLTIEFIALSATGTENIEFKATDKDGQTAKINLQITTEEPAGGPIDTWEMRILGSWNNTTVGSSFASINGNVYMLNEAFANQTLIDFIYWEGASTDATIGAPNDANAELVFNTGPYALVNWTTARNATLFKTTTVNAAAFDAINDAAECIDIATGADQTRIGTLAVDQVIAFVTVTNKHGLIKVKAITPGSDGDITIDIKVEK